MSHTFYGNVRRRLTVRYASSKKQQSIWPRWTIALRCVELLMRKCNSRRSPILHHHRLRSRFRVRARLVMVHTSLVASSHSIWHHRLRHPLWSIRSRFERPVLRTSTKTSSKPSSILGQRTLPGYIRYKKQTHSLSIRKSPPVCFSFCTKQTMYLFEIVFSSASATANSCTKEKSKSLLIFVEVKISLDWVTKFLIRWRDSSALYNTLTKHTQALLLFCFAVCFKVTRMYCNCW